MVAHKLNGKAKWPGKKCVGRIKEREEDSPEGGKNCETSTGSGVGFSREGTKKQSNETKYSNSNQPSGHSHGPLVHISTLNTHLNMNPEAIEKIRNSQTQFHSI